MSFSETLSAFGELRPGKPTWSTDQIPDLSGMVMLVTGGNTGIGKETARVLAKHNARVYIACRDPTKAKAALDDLLKLTGKTAEDVRVIQLDLGDLPSVKKGVDEFLRQESRLDVLFNSAGVGSAPHALLTTHGHDLQFGTNVLGHFYLTQLLLPTLLSSVPTSKSGSVRIVNLSSLGHWGSLTESKGGPIVWTSLEDGEVRKGMNTGALWDQSKAGNILFANALARKYGSRGIVSTSVNPGFTQTEHQRHLPAIKASLLRPFLHPVAMGALTSLFAGTAPEAATLNGKYLAPWARVREPRKDMENVDTQDKLWKWCEEQVKRFAPASES